MESIKNDLVPSFRTFFLARTDLDQKMLETNPEGYSEYFKDLERKQQLAAPQSQPEGDQWPRMEANMKALIDYDPELLKGFDMERMKTSWDFANKVKVKPPFQYLSSITN